MSKFTVPSITALSVAALITFGGIHFAPTPGPAAAPPTTDVPVALLQVERGTIEAGEVTTTIYGVTGTGAAATVGAELTKSTDPTFTAHLPNGQYLLKSVPTPASKLANHHDTDETAPVPKASGCGDRQGCTWIWVDNTREHDTWGLMSSSSSTHTSLEFTFSRRNVNDEGEPLSAPAAPVAPTPPTAATPATPTPPVTSSTPPAVSTPVAPTQDFDILVTELVDGTDIAMPNVAIVVMYEHPTTGVPYTVGARTDASGTADPSTPAGRFLVMPIPPAGYTIDFHTHPGWNDAGASGDLVAVSIGLKKIPAAAPAPAPAAAPAAPNTPATPAVATPPTPQAPATSAPTPATTPATTTPATTIPATTTPPTTIPATTTPPTTTPATTVPAPTEPTVVEQPQRPLGCDETNDEELAALLHVDDGAIRWISGGELHTVYPEPGMNPVSVCEPAYQRLLDMGFDSSYFTGG